MCGFHVLFLLAASSTATPPERVTLTWVVRASRGGADVEVSVRVGSGPEKRLSAGHVPWATCDADHPKEFDSEDLYPTRPRSGYKPGVTRLACRGPEEQPQKLVNVTATLVTRTKLVITRTEETETTGEDPAVRRRSTVGSVAVPVRARWSIDVATM